MILIKKEQIFLLVKYFLIILIKLEENIFASKKLLEKSMDLKDIVFY